MIFGLLALHIAVFMLLACAGSRLGRRSLLVGAVPPALSALWCGARIGADLPATADLAWVRGLDLAMTFRVDAFSGIMALIVSGIGALIFVYAFGYFDPAAAGTGRFAATLLAFSTAMLGLVWADSIWTLFVFWELTSVTSFLLVGHKSTDDAVLAAARRALMVTAGGGLVLLAGLLLVARGAATTLISELAPVDGTSATAGAVLVMIAAATKSAQVPFHSWLPGAMVAPTPVSAYLHSATMVKAGVVLVAVAGPALGAIPAWTSTGLCFGVASVVWGAIGALRHRDAKLILAWGTVSQLGMLITLFSVGTPTAVLAAVTLLVAHALFKGALFLIVGEIDVRAGTRHIDELGGLAGSMPVAFATAVLAGLSMAGAPPLLGFIAKETAIKAVLGLDGAEAWIAGLGVIGGSVLTVGYTIRFLVAVFGPGPVTRLSPRRHALSLPAAALAVAGVAAFALLGPLYAVLEPAAVRLSGGAAVDELHRWAGLQPELLISAVVVVSGSVAGLVWGSRPRNAPVEHGARWTDAFIDGVVAFGRRICVRVQHGSLPVYLVTMAAATSLAAVPFLVDVSVGHLFAWHSPLQALVTVTLAGSALALTTVSTRLGAGLALGAAGILVAALFVIHGAPDLVLTQLLVEAAVVVGFVLAFGQLPRSFPIVGLRWRSVRIAVAVLVGSAVMIGLAAASSSPVSAPPLATMAAAAVDPGGGNNVVNVILTDMRALDTLGEVLVLAMVALGVQALARASRGSEGSLR